MLQRMMQGQQDAHPPGVTHYGAPVFNGRTWMVVAMTRPSSVPRSAVSHRRYMKRVGQGRQPPPELAVQEAMATSARAEHIKLVLLDAILGLASGAVQPFIQLHGIRVRNVGHHEARIDALSTILQARHTTQILFSM